MIRTSFAVVLLAAAIDALAAPPSLSPDLATLQAVPRVEVPAAAVRKALAEPIKGQPYQYAVPVGLALAPRQGVWLVQGDTAIWRLRLHSQDARSLSLHVPAPALPAGATLWTYDPRAQLVHGPVDAKRLTRSGLWTPPVSGEELVVEIRVPAAKAGAVNLGAVQAFHGFRDWKAGGGGGAGDCNVDVTCPAAAEWTQEAGSVARISIGGAFLCSGQLLNNVRQDQKRLFLTANHCGIDEASGPAESVVFYFNYTAACGNTGSHPLPPPTFQTARRLAHDVQSDFALLLITDDDPLPGGAYFAGWDATGADSGAGVAIHHPAGDVKKIAFHDTAPVRNTVNIGTGCPIDAWEVQWSNGTTEGGSSGGGLWDDAHHLIGTLSGGTASCTNAGGLDYFGRFERAWTANAAPDGQLRAHLDPDDSCVAIVPGLDPDTDPQPGPVGATMDNQRCAGEASTCTGRRGGGGALDLSLSLLLLLGAAAQRSRL